MIETNVLQTLSGDLIAIVGNVTMRLLRVDNGAASWKPSEAEWSAKEILGHLVDSAANNHQRFVRTQHAADLRLPGYEQARWVRLQRYDLADWQELVRLWSSYNRHLAHVLRHSDGQSAHVRCVIGDNEPMTLEELVRDYIRHVEHHLAQIEERTALTDDEAPVRTDV